MFRPNRVTLTRAAVSVKSRDLTRSSMYRYTPNFDFRGESYRTYFVEDENLNKKSYIHFLPIVKIEGVTRYQKFM